MELTPAERSHVESPPRESPDSHPPSANNNSVQNNEPKFKLPSGDIVVSKGIKLDSQPEDSPKGKSSKVDSLPEDSSKGKSSKVDSQPENSPLGKSSKVEVADNKSTKSEAKKGIRRDLNWKFLAMAVGILSLVTIGFLAIRLILQSKSEVFKSPDKISALTTAQIDEVIRSSVRLDEKVTLAYLRSKLTVSQFKSQDRQYTVFRMIAPETCGKLGCLYVIKPVEGMSIPLQLEDIGVGKEMFKSSPKFHCFTVIQRQNGEDRNFEICEQNY
jgi:hypothetical protein